ncbi:MAG: O-antigen ligase family protein [Alteromonadaceae bacterium]|nr:O-antigen ligase family protein [Alteromonadaceae bacterium]
MFVAVDKKVQEHVPIIMYLHYITVWMLSAYLLIDIMSGFFVIQFGVDLKLSLLYKMPLFVLLMLLISRYQFKLFILLLFSILLLLIGPTAELFRRPIVSFFAVDFGYVIKILMPVAVFLYFYSLFKYAPDFTEKWIKIALWSNFSFLLINLGFAALGFGRSSYVLSNDETVGANGFIYAANELGPTFIVLFGFALYAVWNNYKKYYLLMSVLTLFCGVLVATKTAMVAAFLLVFLIPLFSERNHFFRFTWLKLKIFFPAIIMIIMLIIFIVDFLEALGLYDKLLWVFSQKGVLGILWSGRDEYSKNLLDVYLYQSNLFQQIFGQGSGGVAEHLPVKYSAEVDAVDTFVWFGFSGLLICFSINFYFITQSAKFLLKKSSCVAPCVLLVNLLLLFLSQISGHVWMSGTLGISFGLINALLLIEYKNKGEKLCTHSL